MNRGTGLGFAGGVAVAALVALALRLFFVLTPHAALDADEAIVGLMGRHVLQGEFPIFYYGQKYMGGLEPHLAALGFAIGGATPLVLKLVCLAAALVLVWLTAELGVASSDPDPAWSPASSWRSRRSSSRSGASRPGAGSSRPSSWARWRSSWRIARSRRPGGVACGSL